MIIGVDFDGILATDTGQFPEIGPPVRIMVSFVKKLIEDAVKWCEDLGLHFCSVNENAPSNRARYAAQYPNGTRKVSADIYIDDHNPAFIMDKTAYGQYIAVQNTIDRVRRIINNEYR